MKTLLLSLGLFFLTLSSQAAYENYRVYTGVMDGKMPITMVLRLDTNPCNGAIVFSGMYRYDKVSKWLLLDIEVDDLGHAAMVEVGLTGILIVTMDGKNIIGTWHSPDGKKSLPIKLRQTDVSKSQLSDYDEEYDEVLYRYNDC